MNGIKLFNDLMEYAGDKGASDVHLVPGRPAMLRIDGELTAAGQEDAAEWQDADLAEVTEQILSGNQLEEYRTKGALVCSYSFSEALRLRVSVYRQQGRDAMSVRLHPSGVPAPEELLLPEEITELVKNGRGLLLVTGGRGSGVTTTVASLAAQIAGTQSKVIVSVEDTTEYILPQGRGLVVQREIGADCASRAEALEMALKQDADVILLDGIGSEREAGLLFAAVRRGQFVILAEKEDSVTAALAHLVQSVGSSPQALLESLAQGLAGAMAQKLLRRQDEAGRVAAYEVLVADAGVRSMIAENRLHQLDTSAGAEKGHGRVRMDDAIYNLYMKSCITSGTAIAGAKDPEDMSRKVRLF